MFRATEVFLVALFGPGSEVDEDWMREPNCIFLRSCRRLSTKVIVLCWALVKMSVVAGAMTYVPPAFDYIPPRDLRVMAERERNKRAASRFLSSSRSPDTRQPNFFTPHGSFGKLAGGIHPQPFASDSRSSKSVSQI